MRSDWQEVRCPKCWHEILASGAERFKQRSRTKYYHTAHRRITRSVFSLFHPSSQCFSFLFFINLFAVGTSCYVKRVTPVLFKYQIYFSSDTRNFWLVTNQSTKDAREDSVEGDGQHQCLHKFLPRFPHCFLFSFVGIFGGILCRHNLKDVSPGAQNAVSGKRARFCPELCTSITAGC